MGMSQETKERLRRLSAEKRKKQPKAKDYELAEWLVISDKVREENPEVDDPNHFKDEYQGGRTLRWVPRGVIEALAGLVPTVQVRYVVAPHKVRVTCVFPDVFIVRLLEELGLPVMKYSSPWDHKSIRRCRPDENGG